MRKTTHVLIAILSMFLLSSCSSPLFDFLKENISGDDEPITFTETTIIDNDECSVIATKIDPKGFYGYTINVVLENKTSDKRFMFSTFNEYVNGLSIYANFSEDVGPGMIRYSQIFFLRADLKEYKIDKITDIEMNFNVSLYNQVGTIANETVHLYPYGEERVTRYERESLDTDNIIVDNEYTRVTIIDYNDHTWGFDVEMFLENKCEEELHFNIKNSYVNDKEMTVYGSKWILPNHSAYLTFGWSRFDLIPADIHKISKIQFDLEASYQIEAFVRDYVVNETFTLNP